MSSDFGVRDRPIAVNSYTTVVGRASLAEERFRAYWRDVHGPLCSRVPGLGFYAQHHFARAADAHLWPVSAPLPGYALDGAVEIGWASEADQSTFQAAASILFDDEQNVFEETAAYALPAGSTTTLDREEDPVPNGPDRFDRLHVHFAPRPGCGEELARLLTGFATDDVVKVRVHAPQPHDNSAPNPPAPNVEHTVADERVELVVLEIAFTDPLARRRFFQSPAFTETVAEQERLAASITPFLVSGVFTFVRDGALTTAGLRGSRVAALIGELAASNQVRDDVVHLMRTGALSA